jgi:hypothetical protein
LAGWGLRQFTSDETYFQWQRETLTPAEITALHRQVEQKCGGSSADEVSFYDTTAHPNILPVLYSQRYDYYLAIGSRVADRIGGARSILDVGCGVGILTTFYARQHPDKTFVGIDRSTISITRLPLAPMIWSLPRMPSCKLNGTLVFPVAVGTPSSVPAIVNSKQTLSGERGSVPGWMA